MLSRTADNLYWLARYIERAEFVARILDLCGVAAERGTHGAPFTVPARCLAACGVLVSAGDPGAAESLLTGEGVDGDTAARFVDALAEARASFTVTPATASTIASELLSYLPVDIEVEVHA